MFKRRKIQSNPIIQIKRKHPEQQHDEMFIGNFTLGNFSELKYQTKRLGKIPRLLNGVESLEKEVFPVFVKYNEYNGMKEVI